MMSRSDSWDFAENDEMEGFRRKAKTPDPLDGLPHISSMPRKRHANPIASAGKNYSMLGRNKIVQASPAIVHFDGYTLKECHTQQVSVINISASSKRIHILPPSTTNFKIRMSKRGLLAPGMSENIKIDFYPSELKYHYDCVKVHTEDENLLIPIHAYPTANDVIFPKFIDFGIKELGKKFKKKYSIRCGVPVQFEFHLDVRKEHPFFTVHPLTGIIPANGSAEVFIEFLPLSSETVSIEVVVNVSQFNFQPFVCTITGSAMSGITRKEALLKGADEFHDEELLDHSQNSTLLLKDQKKLATTNAKTKKPPQFQDSANVLETYDMGFPNAPRGTGAGAVFDAGAAWIHTKRKKQHLKQTKAGRTMPPPGPPPDRPETVVEGLRIPGKLNSNAAVNFVLTQVPGKLKPKDLKKAIDEHREIRAIQKMEQERMRTNAGSLNFQSILVDEQNLASGSQTRQLKEMVFIQEIGEEEKNAKDREFKQSIQHLGDDLMTSEDIEAIKKERLARQNKECAEEREKERERTELRLLGPYEIPANYARVTFPAQANLYHKPDFDPYKNDEWRRRRDLLGKLTYLVGKHIVRARADKRIAAIKEFLGDTKNRDAVRDMVELDNKLAKYNAPSKQKAALPDGGKSLMGSSQVSGQEMDEESLLEDSVISSVEFDISPDSIHRFKFPLFEEDAATVRMEEDAQVDTKMFFNDLSHFQLRVSQEASSIGYISLPSPPVSMYLPLEKDREMLEGAEEEGSMRLARDEQAGWENKVSKVELKSEQADPGTSRAKSTGRPGTSKSQKSLKGVPSPEEVKEETPRGVLIEDELKTLGMQLELGTDMSSQIYSQKREKKETLGWFMPTEQTKIYVPSIELHETDPHSVFDVKDVPRVHRPTEGTRIGYDTGSTSLRLYNNTPTISSRWVMRAERQPSILWCLPNQHKEGIWEMQGLPNHLKVMEKEDVMSDSESDDEEDFFCMAPTEGLALKYFSQYHEGKTVGEIIEQDQQEEWQENDDRDYGVPFFDRIDELQKLENELVHEQLEDAERLSKQIVEISSTINNLKHKFTIQEPVDTLSSESLGGQDDDEEEEVKKSRK
mmetsp:Transcript_18802/g.24219  ORF Transcript_18802/g.24219 Transcript_18802/m.24219 type:complete len:1082 (-) Transcript_18802:17-3262(-)